MEIVMIDAHRDFSMDGEQSILFPQDCGLLNGHITLNGWYTDVAMIQGLYAPPLFSDNFQLQVRFNGRRVRATGYTWSPEVLTRYGNIATCSITSRLLPAGNERGVILEFRLVNHGDETLSVPVEIEMTGGLGRAPLWGFSKPSHAPVAQALWTREVFSLNCPEGSLAMTTSLKVLPRGPVCSGVLTAAKPLAIAPQENTTFYVCLAMAPEKDAFELLDRLIASPEHGIETAYATWQARVDKLYEAMPNFSSSDKVLEALYHRSLLHLLLNEWDVPEFMLHPYYSTGGINGGCIGCYLWNYGEPYRLWSLLNPSAAREHLKAFLRLDLTSCYAFNPDDGSPFGPYYPVNQEKVIFLAHAYVLQTGDVAFLQEMVNGRRIIEHILEQALMHDNLAVPAVLVDYGNGNHHLELRRELRYDGIVPDLNLRRCVNYHLAAALCRLAGVTPPVDLEERAAALKTLIMRSLYDAQNGWFNAIDPQGRPYLRYTLQVFKALGWGDWAMTAEAEDALVCHLMNPAEFRGPYGLHSLSKSDPAYDEFDIDNGGPGACVSFTPAIIDRLYQSGRLEEAETLLKSLYWLAEDLPYWGDSQRADIRDYRRDTPLQNDIQGAAIAQTVIFGLFGVRIREDFSVEITPHLPADTEYVRLENLRLAGHVLTIECSRTAGVTVLETTGRSWHEPGGGTVVVPPSEC